MKTVEQINFGETKQGNKNGRPWTGTRIGLKIGGKWYNNMIFDPKLVEGLRNTDTPCNLDIILFKDSYTKDGETKEYDSFRVPTRIDKIEDRLEQLKHEIERIEGVLAERLATTGLSPVKQKAAPVVDIPLPDEPPDEPDSDLPF